MKNNDKSIAALEGKNLLYDNFKTRNDKYSGQMWKYQNDISDYQKKIILREKFAKQLGLKSLVQPDESLGKIIYTVLLSVALSS